MAFTLKGKRKKIHKLVDKVSMLVYTHIDKQEGIPVGPGQDEAYHHINSLCKDIITKSSYYLYSMAKSRDSLLVEHSAANILKQKAWEIREILKKHEISYKDLQKISNITSDLSDAGKELMKDA